MFNTLILCGSFGVCYAAELFQALAQRFGFLGVHVSSIWQLLMPVVNPQCAGYIADAVALESAAGQ